MEEGRTKMEESRYPEEQKRWMLDEEGEADYLQREIPFKVIARFRLGSENLGSN